MIQATNQLVATAKRFIAPAAVVGAFALGAALFVGRGNVHAASAIDDNSVSALTSLDRAMEAVASRVTLRWSTLRSLQRLPAKRAPPRG